MSIDSKILSLPQRPADEANREARLLVTLDADALREIIRQELGASAPNELFDAETVAKKLSIPLSWVYEQSRLGNIPTHRIGKYIRFNIREILESEAMRKRT